jgi:prepilin-type processing-associated H-X9-DG protein
VLLFVFGPFFFESLFAGDHFANVRLISCQSNMKQLNLALTQYAQDNDGNLPAAETSISGETVTWRSRIFDYTKSRSVYQCPDDAADNSGSSTALPDCYGANHIGLNVNDKERGAFPLNWEPSVSLASLSAPSRTIMLTDMRGYIGGEWNIISPMFLPNTGRKLYAHVRNHAFYEHSPGSVNFLFADGHVKSMKPAATLSPVNLWTRDNAPFAGQEL